MRIGIIRKIGMQFRLTRLKIATQGDGLRGGTAKQVAASSRRANLDELKYQVVGVGRFAFSDG